MIFKIYDNYVIMKKIVMNVRITKTKIKSDIFIPEADKIIIFVK